MANIGFVIVAVMGGLQVINGQLTIGGMQAFAGEATRLAYMTDEAREGRDSFLEHRSPDWSGFPYYA